MTITLIPKSDDDSDRQMPIFHEHTSDFDDWWCKSGFADVDKLIFFRCPKKRVRFDKAKNKIWTIDRYDDKENDKLIFFQPPKKRVRFDESKNEIWTIDRYDDEENDKLIFFQPSKKRVFFYESKNKIWPIDRYDDKENQRCVLNIGFSNEMKTMHSNDDKGSSSFNSDITAENEEVDSTCLHIFCDEDTGRKSLTWRETILKAVRKFSRRLIEYFWRSIVNGFSRFFSCSLGQQRNC